jgi:hypothetical protein
LNIVNAICEKVFEYIQLYDPDFQDLEQFFLMTPRVLRVFAPMCKPVENLLRNCLHFLQDETDFNQGLIRFNLIKDDVIAINNSAISDYVNFLPTPNLFRLKIKVLYLFC